MGTNAVFETAYREHYWAVTRYVARRSTGVGDEVRDVVADVFTTAWRRRAGMPDPALPWLYGVARRTLANHRRGAERRRSLLQRLHEHQDGEESAPSRGSAGQDDTSPAQSVRSALRRLSATDQEVLRLVAWEELTTDGLAVALGCSRSAAAMRLSRARTRLGEALSDQRPSSTTTLRPAPAPSSALADDAMEAGAR